MRHALPALALVLGGFLAVFGDSTPKPALEGLTDWGCQVYPTDSAFPHKTFKGEAWAEHNHVRDWKFTVADEQGKKARRKALLICSDWMDEMDRAKGER